MFKPDLDPTELEENKEEEAEEKPSEPSVDESATSTKNTTQASIDESANMSNVSAGTVIDPTQQAQIQENAMKVLKQHLEIVKLKEELESTTKEKEELEEEISSRNKEIYEMNEKLILMEMNHATAKQHDLNTIQDLKYLLEKQGKIEQTQYDFHRFKDSLERLK